MKTARYFQYTALFADPQIVWREMAVEIEHPTLGRMKSVGSPLKLSATPTNPRRRAPMLGEHTEEMLRDSGFSAGEIVWRFARSARFAGLSPTARVERVVEHVLRDSFTEHGTVVARRTKVNAGEDARVLHVLQRVREAAECSCHPDAERRISA